MDKWEYRTVTVENREAKDFVTKLNIYGQEGWELVSVVGIEDKSIGLFDSGSKTTALVAFLKRKIN